LYKNVKSDGKANGTPLDAPITSEPLALEVI